MADVKGTELTGLLDGFAASTRTFDGNSRKGQFFSFGFEDFTPPEVVVISPTPGTSILRTQALKFQITDNSGQFRRILPAIQFPDGRYEIVHDGEEFTTDYKASSRTVIANGFEYEVTRAGGWPDNPTLVPFAFDISGNEPS